MANFLGGSKRDLNFMKETELCLGLPGAAVDQVETPKSTGKRVFSEIVDLKRNLLHPNEISASDLKETTIKNNDTTSEKNLQLHDDHSAKAHDPAKPPHAKAHVVGWPPVRSYRKNMMAPQKSSKEEIISTGSASFVKVSIDGAPYLRKVDLKMYTSYDQLSDAFFKMFSSFTTGNNGGQGLIDFMSESKLMDLLNTSDYVPTYEDKDGDWMLVGDVPWEMFVDSCKRLRIMKGAEAIGLAPRAMEKCKGRS